MKLIPTKYFICHLCWLQQQYKASQKRKKDAVVLNISVTICHTHRAGSSGYWTPVSFSFFLKYLSYVQTSTQPMRLTTDLFSSWASSLSIETPSLCKGSAWEWVNVTVWPTGHKRPVCWGLHSKCLLVCLGEMELSFFYSKQQWPFCHPMTF